MMIADYFPSAGKPAFTSRDKIAGVPHPSLTLRPCAALRVQARSATALCRREGRNGAADPTKDRLDDHRSNRQRL
jgi:hypothetical protein